LPASIAIYTTVALVAFEGLAVTAALPQVAADLGNVGLLPWVITAYMLTSGVATLVAGPLVDSLGARKVFRWSVTVFSLAGGLAALAPTMNLMIAARALQGIGGGLVVAIGLAAVKMIYPSHLIGRAYAANSTVWGVMGVAGPALAALLLTVADWRWIFGVNVPLGAVSLLAGWRVMPGPAPEAEVSKLDIRGTVLVTAFILSILIAVDRLGTISILWLVASIGMVYLYWFHARRVPGPVVKPEHLIRQPYSGLAAGMGLMLAGAIGINGYLPLYVQGGRGVAPALAAWSVIFLTVSWTTGSNISAMLTKRFAESQIVVSGFGLTVPGLTLIWISSAASWELAWIFSGFVLAGLGVGISTNAALTLLGDATPSAQIGRAMSGHHFARTQGFTLGVALAGAVILLVTGRALGDIETVRQLLAGELTGSQMEAASAIEAGFATAAATCAALAAIGVIPVIALRKHLKGARLARGRTR